MLAVNVNILQIFSFCPIFAATNICFSLLVKGLFGFLPLNRGCVVMTGESYEYDLSSWCHVNDDPHVLSEYAKYICGAQPWPEKCDVIRKSCGYVLHAGYDMKGMGRTLEGGWQARLDSLTDERSLESYILKNNLKEDSKHFDSCILMQQLSDYCDYYFKKCGDCGEKCTHPSGKCSGSCSDCLKEIQ